MTDRLAIALGQLNPTVGAVQANLEKARAARDEAASRGADLFCFRSSMSPATRRGPGAQAVLRARLPRCGRGVGARNRRARPGILRRHLSRGWSRLQCRGTSRGRYRQDRAFQARPAKLRGVRRKAGVHCRTGTGTDRFPWRPAWRADLRGHLDRGGCETLAETGAELLLVPNGSPFEAGKQDTRLTIAVARVTETGLPLAYLNQVGGQDELVFDGGSFGLNSDRTLAFQMPAFKEDIAIIRWTRQQGRWRIERGAVAPQPGGEEEVWQAIVLGTRDYVRKNGFPGVVLGLSGASILPWSPPLPSMRLVRSWCAA